MTPGPTIGDHPVRVLVVDDERDNRELLDVVLSYEGFLVATAASGEEALATVALQRTDLVLLDVMMPGMDGYEVTAKMKGDTATASIPIIIVSALSGARKRALSAGAEDFLAKPLDRDELLPLVRNLLRKTYADYEEGEPAPLPQRRSS